ncbi:hypothetical protein [Mobiluncus porci]|uniref:Scaffolding protein n=1 Tax=Mobiluncus porci TaxID=2652278 RepID=A0A7K0K0B4_9ACTO|nr:hypothetical protein [Mobiluncus porci]MST48923.1 hypothetical protein [Mobiluncus porci]
MTENDAPVEKTFTVAELNERINAARAQAERAGKREVAESLGFEDAEKLKAFIDQAKADRQAAETETEKKERELADREKALSEKTAQTAAAEALLLKKSALIELGATGDNLSDAVRLLDIPSDASADEVKTAAEGLKTRRPEMFNAVKTPNIPPVNTPASPDTGSKPGGLGRVYAEKYGYVKAE